MPELKRKEVMIMKVGFIGAGKVGFSLGKYFKTHNVDVVGYYSRNPQSAEEAADFTGTKTFDTMKQLAEVSDVLFLTVPDGKIAEVWYQMKDYDLNGKIVTHCSGALTSNVLDGAGSKGAYAYSSHPLLAVSDKYESYKDIGDALFTIEGNTEKMDVMCGLFNFCGNRTQQMRAENKVLYHTAASVASNFMVTLADVAGEMLRECGFSEEDSRDAMAPLMMDNMRSILDRGPEKSLTGPIERADSETVKGHLAAIAATVSSTESGADAGEAGGRFRGTACISDTAELYRVLARRTIKLAKRKHPDRDYTEMEEILR